MFKKEDSAVISRQFDRRLGELAASKVVQRKKLQSLVNSKAMKKLDFFCFAVSLSSQKSFLTDRHQNDESYNDEN